MKTTHETLNRIQRMVQQHENKKIDFPEIIECAEFGNVDEIKQIIAKNGNVNYQNADGNTALIKAIKASYNSSDKTVQFLLESGANINLQNKYGDTALLRASQYGNTKVVQLLLEFGADVHLKDNESKDALMLASSRQHNEIVKLLLQYGAEISDDYLEKFPRMISVLKEFLQEQEIA